MNRFPLIMGILNATPDSFFDGGKYVLLKNAVARAEEILKQGGDIIDVGGESTRPGSAPVDVKTEISRVLPIITEIKRLWPGAQISVDTYNYETAKAALEEGAQIINDISGLADTRLAALAAEYGAKLVIMHMRGTPKNMQTMCAYGNILEEIKIFLENKTAGALEFGVKSENIILDPGLGFAKTREQNWLLLENTAYFKKSGLPLLIGASRKSFTDGSLENSLKAARLAAEGGADIIRVHNVAETKKFLENIYAK